MSPSRPTALLNEEQQHIARLRRFAGIIEQAIAERDRPKRIQRRRTKGWRMPEGAIYVGRPTRWGNPWRIGDYVIAMGDWITNPNRAVWMFRTRVAPNLTNAELAPLRGHDLVCWCSLDKPCHADVLLELANR